MSGSRVPEPAKLMAALGLVDYTRIFRSPDLQPYS